MKTVKHIAIGLGILLTGGYLFSLKRAKNKIVTLVTASKNKITNKGILLDVNYNIKNPTKAAMKITPPLIQIHHNGKLLASSSMDSNVIPPSIKDDTGRILIKPFKETGKITAQILITWLDALSISPKLLARLQNKNQKIALEIQTTSQLYTRLGNYPFDTKTTTIL